MVEDHGNDLDCDEIGDGESGAYDVSDRYVRNMDNDSMKGNKGIVCYFFFG